MFISAVRWFSASFLGLPPKAVRSIPSPVFNLLRLRYTVQRETVRSCQILDAFLVPKRCNNRISRRCLSRLILAMEKVSIGGCEDYGIDFVNTLAV